MLKLSDDQLPFAKTILIGCLSLVFVLLVSASFGQRNKNRLEQERKENQRRIQEAARILEQTAEQKTATLGELNAINQQLNARMQMVRSLNEEIGLLLSEIDDINHRNKGLHQDLETMKHEYAQMVYHAAKHKANSKLMFLLASESFFQFWSRLTYLKQFREARQAQVQLIRSTSRALLKQRQILLTKTKERENLLAEEVQENRKLFDLQTAQRAVVKKLSNREKDLEQELEERRERDARLDRLIADMIRREMRRAAKVAKEKAKKEAKKKADAKGKKTEKAPEEEEDDSELEEVEPTTIALSAEGLTLSRNFGNNRNKLLWPVENGFIAEHYGKHAHPVIKHVMVDNLGVDIQTKNNQAVRAVFDGEIGFVALLPGAAGKIVSVIHGDYITVYCNIKEVAVEVGEKIKVGQTIGNVAADKDGVSTLKFQVWRNQNKLNPEQWLRRR